jgi:hypothetical protein
MYRRDALRPDEGEPELDDDWHDDDVVSTELPHGRFWVRSTVSGVEGSHWRERDLLPQEH